MTYIGIFAIADWRHMPTIRSYNASKRARAGGAPRRGHRRTLEILTPPRSYAFRILVDSAQRAMLISGFDSIVMTGSSRSRNIEPAAPANSVRAGRTVAAANIARPHGFRRTVG